MAWVAAFAAAPAVQSGATFTTIAAVPAIPSDGLRKAPRASDYSERAVACMSMCLTRRTPMPAGAAASPCSVASPASIAAVSAVTSVAASGVSVSPCASVESDTAVSANRGRVSALATIATRSAVAPMTRIHESSASVPTVAARTRTSALRGSILAGLAYSSVFALGIFTVTGFSGHAVFGVLAVISIVAVCTVRTVLRAIRRMKRGAGISSTTPVSVSSLGNGQAEQFATPAAVTANSRN